MTMADELKLSMLSMKMCRNFAQFKLRRTFFELFPVCSGCVSLLISHPGWDRQCRRYKQIAIGKMSGDLAKELSSNSISKQNKTTKQQILYKMAIKLSEVSLKLI